MLPIRSFGWLPIIRGIFIVSILSVLVLLSIHSMVLLSNRDRIRSVDEAKGLEVDCILVLGASVLPNKQPSHMLEDRLLQAIELYKLDVSNRLLMSGDHSTEFYDEVNVMKQFAIDAGVTPAHIFMDHAGFSTYESLYRARDIFLAKKVLIVTQSYHMPRALWIAEKLGIEAYGVTAHSREYAGQSYRDMREMLARIKDFTFSMIQPKPTYLGDTIPITGNGNDTNDK
jgi:SanA protein